MSRFAPSLLIAACLFAGGCSEDSTRRGGSGSGGGGGGGGGGATDTGAVTDTGAGTDTGAADTDIPDSTGLADLGFGCFQDSLCQSGLCLDSSLFPTPFCSEPCSAAADCGSGFGFGCTTVPDAPTPGTYCVPSQDCFDNDGDGYGVGNLCDGSDCNDSDLRAFAGSTTPECGGTVDFDCDGAVGCADSSCAASPACAAPSENCTNGIDDDADGLADCRDSDCAGLSVCLENCTDGRDNDGDGRTDCADSDCAAVASCVENCTDGRDNNGNGLVDCADPACTAAPACVPVGGEDCSNLVDDNANDLFDCGDPDCFGTVSCANSCSQFGRATGPGVTCTSDTTCGTGGFCGWRGAAGTRACMQSCVTENCTTGCGTGEVCSGLLDASSLPIPAPDGNLVGGCFNTAGNRPNYTTCGAPTTPCVGTAGCFQYESTAVYGMCTPNCASTGVCNAVAGFSAVCDLDPTATGTPEFCSIHCGAGDTCPSSMLCIDLGDGIGRCVVDR